MAFNISNIIAPEIAPAETNAVEVENTAPAPQIATEESVEAPSAVCGDSRTCEAIDVFNFKDITIKFRDRVTGNIYNLFDNFCMDIKDFTGEGQFISFMGASGCGKSTLLKMMAGLQQPQSGSVLYYGKPLTEKDTIPMIFQQYSSFEWMTVKENVELPMKLRGVDKETRSKKADELLAAVGLAQQANKWAKMPPLSGGQLQRVALARALACESPIMLMDEFSSGLDIVTKRQLQDTVLDVYYNFTNDPTFINVGHDISECVYLSNRIYILTSNPCTIHSVIDIDFGPGHRTPDIRETPKFAEYVRRIDQIMNEINEL